MGTSKLSIMVLIALVITLFTFNSYAQDSKGKHTPEEKAKKITDKMKTALNLTDEQYPQMYSLNLEQIKWKKESKASNLSKTEKKKKREEFKASTKNILTADQIAKYKKFRKKHHKSWFKRTFGIF